MHVDRAARDRPLSREALDQLELAVPRDAGDADDLAAVDGEIDAREQRIAGVVVGVQILDDEARTGIRDVVARSRLRQRLGADHHGRHVVRAERADLARARVASAPQHRHRVAVAGHLTELVGDDEDRQLFSAGLLVQQAEHLVGLARRQHRRRLVEEEQLPVQVELLQDLELLLLARRERAHRRRERHLERLARHELGERRVLALPVDDGRHVVADEHEVLGDGHVRDERELLVDHADAGGMGLARAGERRLAAVVEHDAGGRLLVADHAFHERALARAVLPEQRVELARLHVELGAVERDEVAEAHDEILHL